MDQTASKPKRTIFYSWQSDLPNATNRNLIADALEKAATAIATDSSIEVEPVIERDTKGISGSPDISKTILEKIDQASVFVADVSIINDGDKGRPTPNPNVLIELGYALKTLGWNRVILVMNGGFGKAELLPFDLKMHRVIVYQSLKEDKDRGPTRKGLGDVFEEQIRLILREPLEETPQEDLRRQLIEMIEAKSPARIRETRKYMQSLNDALDKEYPGKYTGTDYDELVVQSLQKTEQLVADFGEVIEAMATFDDDVALKELFQGFKRLLENYKLPIGYSGRYSTADHDYYRFLGDELFTTTIGILMREGKWGLVKAMVEARLVITNFGGSRSESVGFEYFSCFNMESFVARDQRLRRISCRADILVKRHAESPIKEALSKEDYIAADYLLLLKSKAKVEESWLGWMGWSTLFMKDAPEFLMAAQSKKVIQEIISALDIPSIDKFKEVVQAANVHLARIWGSLWGVSINPETVKKIGIHP